MTNQERIKNFKEWQNKLYAYQYALTIIGIDGVDCPPSGGSKLRNERTAFLAGEAFSIENDSENYENMKELLKLENLDPILKRELELHFKSVSKLQNVPKEEYVAYRKMLSESEDAWLKYKAESNWETYAPYLERLVAQYKKIISYRNDPRQPYDIMLDDDQIGWNMEKYDAFFEKLKERLIPLIRKVVAAKQIDDSFMYGDFAVEKQREYMKKIVQYLGFTPDWGKYSESEHPLTTGVFEGDVRFTTKFRNYSATDAILSTVHETGHAWYMHNVDPAYDGGIIAYSINAGIHESQSRLCENHLGRSKAFWKANYPGLQKTFPEHFENVSLDEFVAALNVARPSLVRTEADELTYPIHIIIRYEIEKMMLNGECEIKDLNKVWNRLYKEYLGVDVTSDRDGILQDMHWPYAYFGYFPTYALGSAFAAQFFHKMEQEIPVETYLETNEYPKIQEWLKENVHRYGNFYSADEVMKMATGEEFDPKYYLDYLEKKYAELYQLNK